MVRKLCVALLCLLMVGLLGYRPTEDSFVEVFTESVTKIDLSAPESQKYRDWLKVYYDKQFQPPYSDPRESEMPSLEPASTEPKTPKPDIRASKNEWDRKWVESSYSQEGQAWEGWKTWDWNDTWELESYSYIKGWVQWEVLRMRNKATGEIQLIDEIITDTAADDYGTNFEVAHIDEAYVVYSIGDFEDWWYYFYSPGQGEAQYIGRGGSSGFLDGERTKWWCREHATNATDLDWPSGLDFSELDEAEYTKWWHLQWDSVLYYTDLSRLAGGDADAKQEIIRGASYCTNAWMAERDGRSVICFYVMSGYPHSKERDWGDPYRIGIYDPLDGQIQEYLEVPPMNWFETVEILPNRFYLFNKVYKLSEDGIELVFSEIDFYVINLDL